MSTNRSKKRSRLSRDTVDLRMRVSKAVYKAWIRAKAELEAKSNADLLKKLLMKTGFYTELDEFT